MGLMGFIAHFKKQYYVTQLRAGENWHVKKRAVVMLEKMHWYPQKIEDKIIFFVTKGCWSEVVVLGPSAVDLLASIVIKEKRIQILFAKWHGYWEKSLMSDVQSFLLI